MKFYLVNCLLFLIITVEYGFTLPTFDDIEDELIQFDIRAKRDTDDSSSSSEEGTSKVKSTTPSNAAKKPGSSSSSSEEVPKLESTYEKQKKEFETLEEKLKQAREKLARNNQITRPQSKSSSDVFVMTPPGWTTPEPPTKESLFEKQKKAMENLSKALKDAVKQYEENTKKVDNSTINTISEDSNVQKRSINLNELRDQFEQHLIEIRGNRASRQKRASRTLRSTSNSDQSLLQLLNDIQTMTAQVREIRSKVEANRT